MKKNNSGDCTGNHSGFTLIELISVIVVIGVLLGVALPRFINLEEDAHTSIASISAGAFREAVSIFNMAWIAKGKPAVIQSVPMNEFGFPGFGAGHVMTEVECQQLFEGIMETSHSVIPVPTPPPTPPPFAEGDDVWGALSGGTFCVFVIGGNFSPPRFIGYAPDVGVVTSGLYP